jgi:hypothetical protein
MPAKVRDFVEVWQELNREGKEKAFRFMIEAYGKKNLLTYLQSIETNSNFLVKEDKDETF